MDVIVHFVAFVTCDYSNQYSNKLVFLLFRHLTLQNAQVI